MSQAGRFPGVRLFLLLALVAALGGTVAPTGALAQPPGPAITIGQTTLGSIFFADQQVAFEVSTTAGELAWDVRDLWGREVARGTTKVKQGAERLVVPKLEPGYYLLAARATANGGATTAVQNSFAVLSRHDFGATDDSRFAMNTKFGQFQDGAPAQWDPVNHRFADQGIPYWDLAIMPLLEASGARRARDTLAWNQIEPERGLYTAPDSYDAYMRALQARGIRSLSLAIYGNKLYDVDAAGVGAAPFTDAGRAAYARYARAVLERYGDQIEEVEVWNEYNGVEAPWNRGPCKAKPECYYQMLKVTYETIKATHPRVRVVGPAGVTIPYKWLEDLFKLGALQYLDAVTVHPYAFPRSPEEGYGGPNLAGAGIEDRVNQLQELIKKYNNGQPKPIYFTEIGWGSQQASSGVSERTQAQYLVRSQVLALAAGVERIYWYEFMNKKVLPEGPGANYGLLRSPGDPVGTYAPKPSYVSYSVLTRQLAGAPFAGRDATPEGIRSYRFRQGERDTRVMWAPQGPRDVTIATGRPITIVDMMGREATYEPHDGQVYLTLNQDPLYVVGEVSGIAAGSIVSLSAGMGIAGGAVPVTLGVDNRLSDARGALPVQFRLAGERQPVTVVARPGEIASEQLTISAPSRPGPLTLEAEVKIHGKRAGKLRAETRVEEGLDLRDGQAAAVLTKEPRFHGLTAKPGDGPAEALLTPTKGGRECWSTNSQGKILYLYFNLDDRFIYDNRGEPVEITVTYFDEGQGHFALAYDGESTSATYTAPVRLTDTKTWRTHTLQLTDAKFANRLGGHDFRVGIYSPALGVSPSDVCFHEVTVRKLGGS